jgi:D-arabinose 1-dehydrogenase-like Zn-dependent alcohol dehydrogenase
VALRLDARHERRRIGHEFLGVTEDAGPDVSGLKAGDLVLVPFVRADNTCDFCRQGPADLVPARRRVGRQRD